MGCSLLCQRSGQSSARVVGRWVKWPTVQLTLKLGLKPQANGRSIVGQQLPTLLDVTCCVRLHTGPCCMLLGVVAQSLKVVKLLATCKRTQQLPTLLGQQSRELLRLFAHSLIDQWVSIFLPREKQPPQSSPSPQN